MYFGCLTLLVSSFVFYADLADVTLAFIEECIYFNKTIPVLVVIAVMTIILKQSSVKL